MAVNIPGLTAMLLFYLLVLGVGIWASVKSKREASRSAADKIEMALLGNRGVKKAVGIFTMRRCTLEAAVATEQVSRVYVKSCRQTIEISGPLTTN